MWKSQASFCNTLNYAYGDVVLDNRALFTVVQVHPVDPICPTHSRLAGVKIVKNFNIQAALVICGFLSANLLIHIGKNGPK
jgi:hypothetical protein